MQRTSLLAIRLTKPKPTQIFGWATSLPKLHSVFLPFFCTVLVSQNPHCWQTEPFLSGFWKNIGKSWDQFLETLKRWSLTWFHPLFGSQWNHIISSFGLASRVVPGIDPSKLAQPNIHRPISRGKVTWKRSCKCSLSCRFFHFFPAFWGRTFRGKFSWGKTWAGWSWC